MLNFNFTNFQKIPQKYPDKKNKQKRVCHAIRNHPPGALQNAAR